METAGRLPSRLRETFKNMKMRKITFVAWGAVAIALAAWVAVAMFAWTIFTQESERSSRATDAEAVTARETASLRLRALARDTKSAREQLDALTKTDVLRIADMIEEVGKSAGVNVKINGAEPETVQPPTKAQSLYAINFLVETEGAFPALMYAAALFENLPVFSSVQSLEFERAQNSDSSAKNKKALWRLNARIKVMTTADISS